MKEKARPGEAKSPKKKGEALDFFWVAGVNPVREALRRRGGAARELVCARRHSRIEELLLEAEKQKIPVRSESREGLTSLVGNEHHQGVALRLEGSPYVDLESLLQRSNGELDPLMVLDCVQDPQNLGALLRSACFLGAGGVVIPKDRSAGITPAVMKVAAGAVSYLPLCRATNLARTLEALKDKGFWIVGLDVAGERSIYEGELPAPAVLVVGNEEKGIRPLVRRCCDLLVRIPALGPLDSLNAATSGAVALAELQRRRSQAAGR